MKDKKSGGSVSYVVALLAAILGIEWGFEYILDVHRRARTRNGLRKVTPKKA